MSKEIEVLHRVPCFDAGKHKPKPEYRWWAWHPLYPYWSKSCWSGATLEEAMSKADRLEENYALALVLQEGGAFTVIQTREPKTLKGWPKEFLK